MCPSDSEKLYKLMQCLQYKKFPNLDNMNQSLTSQSERELQKLNYHFHYSSKEFKSKRIPLLNLFFCSVSIHWGRIISSVAEVSKAYITTPSF